MSCLGPAEAGEHAAGRRNLRHNAASNFGNTPPPYPSGPVTTQKIEDHFLEAASIFRDYNSDSFGSIRYNGQEIPRHAIVKDLFTLVDRLVDKIKYLDPDFFMDNLPILEWTPRPETWREIYPDVDLEERAEYGRRGATLAGIGMFRRALNEYSTNFLPCTTREAKSYWPS